MKPKDAVSVVDHCIEALLGREHHLIHKFPYTGDYINAHIAATLAGSPIHMPSDALHAGVVRQGPAVHQEIMFVSQDAAVRRLWQQNKIVYHVDSDLWAELGDTDPDTVIPPDLFSRLPHPDPFIALPEPLILPLEDGYQQRVVGFFVRGEAPIPVVPNGNLQVSTHSPNSVRIGLLVVGLVETTDGKPRFLEDDGSRDAVFTKMSLEPRAGKGTVADMIAGTINRFRPGRDAGDWRADVPRMVQRAVSLLVYLCASNADTQVAVAAKPEKKARKASKDNRGPSRPTVIGVGYRVGQALRDYRASEHEASAESTGRTMAPHLRRAHFHTYKVGPGRNESRVRWLAPIPINMDGPADETTVIKIPSRAGRS